MVYVYQGNKTYEYQVTEKKITEADDLSFLTDSGEMSGLCCRPAGRLGPALSGC